MEGLVLPQSLFHSVGRGQSHAEGRGNLPRMANARAGLTSLVWRLVSPDHLCCSACWRGV
jgi:hypothetical protein